MSPHHSDKMSQRSQVSRIVSKECTLMKVLGSWIWIDMKVVDESLCQVKFTHHSDEKSQRFEVCMSKLKVP